MAGYTKNSDGTYSVNYDDERFKAVENEKSQSIKETENMYDNMINNSNKYYQDQINASKEWADKQSKLQQDKTNFLIEKTEQEKQKAEADYTKEQKGAYSDYMKQSNDYGIKAEQLASSGLQNSGYSESSKVSMWNTYQNRYASARESFNQAVLNYNNAIKEAQLANNEALAQISHEALQNQLELSLQGFEYKNSLLQTKKQQVNQLNDTYYNRYQNVLAQINAEIDNQVGYDKWKAEQERAQKELAEKIRQINLEHDRWMKEFEANQKQRKIENALKEKESERNYQLALAQEKRAERAASSSSTKSTRSSGSYSVNSGNIGKVENKKPTLSSNAQQILNIYNGSQNMNGFMANTGIKAAMGNGIKPYIMSQYNAGKISDTDAELLFEKLGL